MTKFSAVSRGTLASVIAVMIVGVAPAAAAPDYGTLPVNPNVITDSTAYLPTPPVLDPDGHQGVRQEFNHRDGTRGITTTIRMVPNPQDATGSLEAMRADLAPTVLGGGNEPVPVGNGGTLVTGTSPDGTKSVGVLTFTQGNAAVQVQFDGPANDPVPVDLVTQYGQDQAAAINRQLGN
jgi:hypothetical protein